MLAAQIGQILNQLAADALAAAGGIDEKILKIAGGTGEPGADMYHADAEAGDLSAALGDPSDHRYGGVENAPPGQIGDVRRNLGFIENQISGPKPAPGGFIRSLSLANGQRLALRVVAGVSASSALACFSADWKRASSLPVSLRPDWNFTLIGLTCNSLTSTS